MYTVGISGKARSGKDTVADLLFPLLQDLPLGIWQRTAFAYKVKDVICQVFGVDLSFIEEWKTREEIPPGFMMNMREAMINVGDRLREIKPDCWLQLPLRIPKNRLITDVRYPNEAQLVNSVGFVIRVVNPASPHIDNPSETSLDTFDRKCHIWERPSGPISLPGIPYNYVIQNVGSLKDLEREVRGNLIHHLESQLKFFCTNS